MKLDKYFNKFNITRNGFILLIVAISLLMLNGKVFSADKNVPNPLTFVNNKVTETLQEPLKRLKNVIDLINLKYQDALSNEVEVQVSPDLKWAFEAEGISLVQPVVNQEDGTVFAATTDIDVNVRVRNLLRRKKRILDIGKLESKLHALKPDTISNKGDKKARRDRCDCSSLCSWS